MCLIIITTAITVFIIIIRCFTAFDARMFAEIQQLFVADSDRATSLITYNHVVVHL